MLKDNWGLGDTVLPENFNDMCKGINKNENDISLVQNEFINIENNKYSLKNGICKVNEKGYLTNVSIKGETLLQCFRGINTLGLFYDNYSNRYLFKKGKYTIIRPCDKNIHFEIKKIDTDEWVGQKTLYAHSNETVFELEENQYISNAFGDPNDGWNDKNKHILGSVMILEGEHLGRVSIPTASSFLNCTRDWYNDSISTLSTYNENTDDYIILNKENFTIGNVNSITGEDLPIEEHMHLVKNDFIDVIGKSRFVAIEVEKNCELWFEKLIAYDKNKNIIPLNSIYMDTHLVLYKLADDVAYIRFILYDHKQQADGTLNKVKNIKVMFTECDYRMFDWGGNQLPNGIADSVEYVNGDYYSVQRIKYQNIIGMDNIISTQSLPNTTLFYMKNSANDMININDNKNVLCNRFVSDLVYSTDKAGFYLNYHKPTNEPYVYLRVPKVFADTADKLKRKLWEIDHLRYLYELQEYKYKKIDNLNLRTFGKGTVVLYGGGKFKGNCEFEVTNNLLNSNIIRDSKLNTREPIENYKKVDYLKKTDRSLSRDLFKSYASNSFYFGDTGLKGALVIKLPYFYQNKMISMDINIANYQTGDSRYSKVLIGGYDYMGSNENNKSWISPSANTIGQLQSTRVRFGGDFGGNNSVIIIGEPTNNWSYLRVSIENIMARGKFNPEDIQITLEDDLSKYKITTDFITTNSEATENLYEINFTEIAAGLVTKNYRIFNSTGFPYGWGQMSVIKYDTHNGAYIYHNLECDISTGGTYINYMRNGVLKGWRKVTTSSTFSILEQQVSELEIQLMERGV